MTVEYFHTKNPVFLEWKVAIVRYLLPCSLLIAKSAKTGVKFLLLSSSLLLFFSL